MVTSLREMLWHHELQGLNTMSAAIQSVSFFEFACNVGVEGREGVYEGARSQAPSISVSFVNQSEVIVLSIYSVQGFMRR